MPIPAYMKISDFEGSVSVQGREGTIEVLGFEHDLHIPTDRKNGTAAGTRVHGQFEITKNFDKSSPELYKYLCNGKAIGEVTLNWYQINPAGEEVVYFTHVLTNARVTQLYAWMPNVDDPSTERYKHMEKVAFQYEKINWKFADGNIEHSDSWIEGR